MTLATRLATLLETLLMTLATLLVIMAMASLSRQEQKLKQMIQILNTFRPATGPVNHIPQLLHSPTDPTLNITPLHPIPTWGRG